MEVKWEYPLPTGRDSKDHQYESPILEYGSYVYYVSSAPRRKKLHIIHKDTGTGTDHPLYDPVSVIPSDYFFLSHNGIVILYTGDLHFVRENTVLETLSFLEKGKITSWLIQGKRIFASCSNGRHTCLCCVDLGGMCFSWSVDITNSKPYRAGELAFLDGKISCYGCDRLLFLCPDNGVIDGEIGISRVEKLYCPIQLDEDTLLIGYTNWTTAGVLKYRVSTKKVLWRHKRKFEGPQLKCRIYRDRDRVYWVKNSTELICVDIESGAELCQLRTEPWLYTDLRFYPGGILYGTSGRDGYLNCADRETLQLRWSAFLKNGCAYYGIWKDSIFVGDFDKTVKRFSPDDGRLIDEIPVGGEVVGQITVSEECLYTVIWGDSEKNIRLVKIRLP